MWAMITAKWRYEVGGVRLRSVPTGFPVSELNYVQLFGSIFKHNKNLTQNASNLQKNESK